METSPATTPKRLAWLAAVTWWLAWVVVSGLAYYAAFRLSYRWVSALAMIFATAPWDAYVPFTLPVNAVCGLVIGALQLPLLRRHLSGRYGWLGWTTLGWLLVPFAPMFGMRLSFDRTVTLAVEGAAVGALLGLLQWLALRHRVKAAAWWVAASSASWTAGMLMFAYFSGLPVPDALNVGLAVASATSAMVTGVGFAALGEAPGRRAVTAGMLSAATAALLLLALLPISIRLSPAFGVVRTGYRVVDAALSADGTRLATIGRTTEMRDRITVWETHDWSRVSEIRFKDSFRTGLDLSPDASTLISHGIGTQAAEQLLDAATGQELWMIPDAHVATFSPDGRLIALAYRGPTDYRLGLVDAATGQQLVNTSIGDQPRAIRSLAFSPSGKLLVSAGYPSVIIRDARTLAVRQILGQQAFNVDRAFFSADGRYVVTAGNGTSGSRLTVRVWDVERRQDVTTTQITRALNSIALSPDGKLLAIAYGGKRAQPIDIQLYDLSTGQLVHTYGGHADQVSSLLFSADGGQLISASWDGTLRIWDLPIIDD